MPTRIPIQGWEPSARTVFLIPPLVLAAWGGTFLYLAASGRLRVLLNPLFWPVEIGCGIVLIALATGYFIFFNPVLGQTGRTLSRRSLLQMGVLIVPLFVATCFAPPSFSAAALERRAGLSGGKILAQAAGSEVQADHVEIIDLATAAYYPEHIPAVSGKHVSYTGQYFPGSNGEFRFCRVLMSCCAQDATPLYLHVVGVAPGFEEMQWIDIEGETFFRKDDGQWTPCVRLEKVTASHAPPDPYLYPVRSKPSP